MGSDRLVDTDTFVDQLRGAAKLPATVRELSVNRVVANRAGLLRRTVGIATPDALIAATALVHGLTVVTRSERHYARIPGLQVELPS